MILMRAVCSLETDYFNTPPDPNVHPKDLYLRIDHQTFRKLPKTRVIAFGV